MTTIRRGTFAGVELSDIVQLIEDSDDPDDLVAVIAALEDELTWQPFAYQRPPSGDWWVWLFQGGRFTGKTDTDAYWMNEHAQGPPCDPRLPGGHRMSILAPTLGDAVESCVNGPSGLKAHNPDVKLVTRAGGTVVVWPNGAEAMLFGGWTAQDVERFRAKGNRCACWIEEAAAIPQLEAAFDQIPFSHRLGRNPQVVMSTTPKPRPLLKKLNAHARAWPRDGDKPSSRLERVRLTKASSRMNPTIERDIVEGLYREYGTSRFGRQELEGELLDDYEGALWHRHTDEGTGLDDLRIEAQDLPTLVRRYVGVDPSTWGLKIGDRVPDIGEVARGIETGIVVGGVCAERSVYTLGDYSKRCAPAEWADITLSAYYRWTCHGIVFETNAGGAMGPAIIMAVDKAHRLEHPNDERPPVRFYRDPKSPKRVGVQASDGKRARAEPIAALAEVGRHHMVGVHPYLEDQLCGWDPNEPWSPDRLDAFVWKSTACAPWRPTTSAGIGGSQPRGSITRG